MFSFSLSFLLFLSFLFFVFNLNYSLIYLISEIRVQFFFFVVVVLICFFTSERAANSFA